MCAAGFDRSVPGYPRYEIVGLESQQEYDLMIRDVQISDDDVYECQVGPANGEPPLVGTAMLTVLGKYRVHHLQRVLHTCHPHSPFYASPYRGDNELM